MAWIGSSVNMLTSSLAKSSLRQPFSRGGECLVKMEAVSLTWRV